MPNDSMQFPANPHATLLPARTRSGCRGTLAKTARGTREIAPIVLL
jgi:hypothetical protein